MRAPWTGQDVCQAEGQQVEQEEAVEGDSCSRAVRALLSDHHEERATLASW